MVVEIRNFRVPTLWVK